jgi:hypothetical protein
VDVWCEELALSLVINFTRASKKDGYGASTVIAPPRTTRCRGLLALGVFLLLALAAAPAAVAEQEPFQWDSCTACGNHARVTLSNTTTSTSDSQFHDCGTLVSVVIPNSVTSIGNSVFQSCYALAAVSIPDSVTSIGDYTFYCCEYSRKRDQHRGLCFQVLLCAY